MASSPAPNKSDTFLSALLAWQAAGAATGLAFGLFLLSRNAVAGFGWHAIAVFLGASCLLQMGIAVVTGLAVRTLGIRFVALRPFELHVTLATVGCLALLGYDLVRELNEPRIYRWLGAFVGLVAGLPLGRRLAVSRVTRAGGAIVTMAGTLSVVLFFVAAYDLRRPKTASAPADPRDFVSRFDPLPSPPERDATGGRVLVLGLDGIGWDAIDPLAAAGRLPNFARLKREGATARLRTMEPTISPIIWTTMATGQLPSRHRIEDFVLRRALFLPAIELRLSSRNLRDLLGTLGLLRIVPVTSNLRMCKAIWNVATELQLRTVLAGWWASYPAEPILGFVVSDVASDAWVKEMVRPSESLAEFRGVTHPPELLQKLAPFNRGTNSVTREDLARFFEVDDEAWREYQSMQGGDWEKDLSVFHGTYLRDELLSNATLWLDETERPDLTLCYLRLTDDMGHKFWEYTVPGSEASRREPKLARRYRDVIANTYAWADAIVGRFLARLGPKDVLLVLSDHGWAQEPDGKWGHHFAPDGILAAIGGGVKKGFALPQAPHVLDVGPTLLYLLGIPKGDDMPGRALTELLAEPRPARSIPTWETSRFGRLDAIEAFNAADREAELRGVGYLGK